MIVLNNATKPQFSIDHISNCKAMKPILFSIVFISCFVFSYAQPATKVSLSEFGLSFMPDYTFKGSSLKGWHVLGDADWQAKDGELIGKAKSGG